MWSSSAPRSALVRGLRYRAGCVRLSSYRQARHGHPVAQSGSLSWSRRCVPQPRGHADDPRKECGGANPPVYGRSSLVNLSLVLDCERAVASVQGSLRGEAARIRWIGRSCLMQSLVITLCILLSPFAQGQQKDSRTLRTEADVQQQLFSLPYYTIFDFLAFRVEPGGTIRLLGQVVRPTLKDDAERRVKRVEGVDTVINEIEVLPTSPT